MHGNNVAVDFAYDHDRGVQVAAGKAAAEQVTALSTQLSTARRELEAAATAAEELSRERVINFLWRCLASGSER